MLLVLDDLSVWDLSGSCCVVNLGSDGFLFSCSFVANCVRWCDLVLIVRKVEWLCMWIGYGGDDDL